MNMPDGAKKLLAEMDQVRITATMDDYSIKRSLLDSFLDRENTVEACKQFVKNYPMYYDINKIWWVWNHERKAWEISDKTNILNKLYDVLNSAIIIEQKNKTKFIEAMMMASRQMKPKEIQSNWIQFKNCVVALYPEEDRLETFEATPEYFFTNPIEYDFEEINEKPEEIDKLFRSWVNDNKIEMLYEIAGYSMLPDYPIHRLFCFTGGGRNGKSKYLKLIRKLVGKENISSTDLERLNTRFESGRLFKKLVAMIGETNFNILKNTKAMKELVGEDLIPAEIKHAGHFEFENYAKIMMATNSIPVTLDKTEGFFDRWIIIKFPNKFNKSKCIINSLDEEEIKKLANYSVYKLLKLLKNGSFTNEGTSEQKRQVYENESNPLLRFIHEKCVKDFEGEIILWEFVERFESYLAENGLRRYTNKEIGRMIKDHGYDTHKKHFYKNGSDKQWQVILGLGWKPEPKINEKSLNGFTNVKDNSGIDGTDGTHISLSSLHVESKSNIGTLGTLGTGDIEQNNKNMTTPQRNDKNIDIILEEIGENEISYFELEQNLLLKGITEGFTNIYLEKMENEGLIYRPRPDKIMKL